MTTEPLGPDDSFSWFDLVILETPFDTVPRTENGVSLVWHSHSNGSSVISFTYGQQGKRFDLEEDEDETVRRRGEMIKGSLKVSISSSAFHHNNSYHNAYASPEMPLAFVSVPNTPPGRTMQRPVSLLFVSAIKVFKFLGIRFPSTSGS